MRKPFAIVMKDGAKGHVVISAAKSTKCLAIIFKKGRIEREDIYDVRRREYPLQIVHSGDEASANLAFINKAS